MGKNWYLKRFNITYAAPIVYVTKNSKSEKLLFLIEYF